MLLPALGKVKAAAQGVNCLSNLKQLSLASISYTDDFDGFLWSSHDGVLYNCLTSTGYIPYKSDTFVCPSRMPYKFNNSARYQTYASREWNDLPASSKVRAQDKTSGTDDFVKVKGVGKPSYFLQHGDSRGSGTSQYQNSQSHICYDTTGSHYAVNHGKKANFNFLDGHAEGCTVDDYFEKVRVEWGVLGLTQAFSIYDAYGSHIRKRSDSY